MEGHASHELDVVVPLSDDAGGCFADDGECLDQEVVDVLAVVESLAELGGLRPQGIIGEHRRLGLDRVDVGDDGLEGLDLLALAAAEDS